MATDTPPNDGTETRDVEAMPAGDKGQINGGVDKIGKALAKAQAEMKTAKFNKTNPHFKSKYADLAAIREATIKALTSNGLALYQGTRLHNDGVVLHTKLIHDSGQTLESDYPIPMDQPQKMGSAITYARRYCWSAMCGIVADDDDDANAATGNSKAKAPAPRTDPRAGGQHEVGAFILYDAFGVETEKFERPEDFLVALGNNIKDNSAWFTPNQDQVGYLENLHGGQIATNRDGTERADGLTIAKWCQRVRKLAAPPQTALEAG